MIASSTVSVSTVCPFKCLCLNLPLLLHACNQLPLIPTFVTFPRKISCALSSVFTSSSLFVLLETVMLNGLRGMGLPDHFTSIRKDPAKRLLYETCVSPVEEFFVLVISNKSWLPWILTESEPNPALLTSTVKSPFLFRVVPTRPGPHALTS